MFGRYLLVQRLSRGGMGEIFLAKHGLAGFEKLAVIKKVLPHLAADASFISRFVDEAQVAIKLQHVNVAQVFEVGRVGDEYFLALEYVEGRDLRRTLALLTSRRQRLPVDLALFIGRELANGLAYAHRRTSSDGASLNLVHCDISPPNVLVSFEGETKVIDFGIAKSAIRGTATDPKMGFGKFGYMAPEQLIRGGVVDFRTDIYAAGVVLYELLTGKRLYEAGSEPDYRGLARKVAKGEHDLPSDTDPALAPYDDLVATALRPRPEDRYQSAAELRDAIQQCLVAINPTISTDQLGAYMRELFADEMTAQRELHERVAKANLADFQDQLTQSTQAIGTVTFALANLPIAEVTRTTPQPQRSKRNSVPPPLPGRASTQPPASRPPSQSARPTPTPTPSAKAPAQPPAGSTVDLLADGTGTADRVMLEPSRPSRLWLSIGVAAVLVAGSLVAWAAWPTDKKPDAAPVVAKVEPPETPKGSGLTVQPIEPPPQPPPVDPPKADPPKTDPPKTDDSGGIEIDKQPKPPVQPPKQPHTGGQVHVQPPPHNPDANKPKTPALTIDTVKAKFGAAAHEYRAYKEQYGTRLEKEWNDLASWVTYHSSDLEEASRRIDAFRAKLHE